MIWGDSVSLSRILDILAEIQINIRRMLSNTAAKSGNTAPEFGNLALI
jgi:hypothetical protein